MSVLAQLSVFGRLKDIAVPTLVVQIAHDQVIDPGSAVGIAAFAVLHGLAWGIRGPLMQAIRADYFGAGNFGAIMGASSTLVMIGTISGPLVAGYMADRFGNYQTGFTVIALAAFAGSIFFLLSTKPEPPRERLEQAA